MSPFRPSRIVLALGCLLPGTPAHPAELVAASVDGSPRERPQVFADERGEPAIAVLRNHRSQAGEIVLHYTNGEQWSSGAGLALSSGNFRVLEDAGALGAWPALVYLYDETDYASLLDVELTGSTTDAFPYPEEELLSLMDQVRQVHISMMVEGSWSATLAVPLTRSAKRARLFEGDENALLVVVKDTDGTWETSADEELFALVWADNRWSEPVQLTDDDLPAGSWSAVAVDGGFLLAWGLDGDGDTSTRADREIWAARIQADGGLTEPSVLLAGPYSSGLPASPVCTWRDGQPVVLWTEGDAGVGETTAIVEAVYDGGWSEPADTDLPASQLVEVRSLVGPDDAGILVFRNGPRFQVATGDTEGWSLSASLYDAPEDSLQVREWDAAVFGDRVHLALTGRVGRAGSLAATDSEALYHAELPLAADLELLELEPIHRKVLPSVPFEVRVLVRNRGATAAEDVVLSFEGATPVDASEAEIGRLRPGVIEEVRLQLTVEDAISRWGVRAAHDAEDANPADDALDAASPVLPDFHIAAVEVEGTQVRVDVRETVGVLAPATSVQLSLQRESGLTELGTLSFDSRDPRPLTLSSDSLADLVPPYRVLARVNPGRTVAEADYSNNMGSAQERSEHNFWVRDAVVEDGNVRVEVVADNPESAPDEVAVWVTASPEEATSSLKTGWTGDEVETVALDDEGHGWVTLTLPEGEGFLYAVVNPGHIVVEPTRTDNVLRFARTRRGRVDSALQYLDREEACGALTLRFVNHGSAPALGAFVTLYDDRDLPVAERVLPVADAGGTVSISFDDLSDGTYRLALYRPDQARADTTATALDPFVAVDSLDGDRDGFETPSCGGLDCDDGDASVYPGSADYDDLCREKVKVGCTGCSAARQDPTSLALISLLCALGLLRRRARSLE